MSYRYFQVDDRVSPGGNPNKVGTVKAITANASIQVLWDDSGDLEWTISALLKPAVNS